MSKQKNYLSGREIKAIARANAKEMKRLEAYKNRRAEESEFLTQMKDPNNILEIEDLHTSFFTEQGVVKAVNGVSYDVPKNAVVGVVGESGCGKTTLLRILGGFLDADEGSVMFDGEEISKKPPYERELNTVFQKYALFPHLSVYENIAFAQRVTETSGRIIKKKVPAALSLVGLAQKYKAFPKELSGGEQQRVAIARALAKDVPVIIAYDNCRNLSNLPNGRRNIPWKKIKN